MSENQSKDRERKNATAMNLSKHPIEVNPMKPTEAKSTKPNQNHVCIKAWDCDTLFASSLRLSTWIHFHFSSNGLGLVWHLVHFSINRFSFFAFFSAMFRFGEKEIDSAKCEPFRACVCVCVLNPPLSPTRRDIFPSLSLHGTETATALHRPHTVRLKAGHSVTFHCLQLGSINN